MNKKIGLIIGIALMVAGGIFAALTDVAADLPAVAITAFGLGITIMSVWNKAQKKDWKLKVALACMSVGGFCCALAGCAEETMTQLVSLVIAVVTIIAGLLTYKKLS